MDFSAETIHYLLFRTIDTQDVFLISLCLHNLKPEMNIYATYLLSKP